MRVKSPLRLTVAIIILILFIYLGVCGAVSIIKGAPMTLAPWSGSKLKAEEVQDILIAGTDVDGYRTDLILLCRYDANENRVSVLQIPRDTKVETDTRHDKKINSAYSTEGKEKTLCDEVAAITGIKPDKYVIVSLNAFREIIDVLGGVEVNVPMRMYYTDPEQNLTIDLYPGVQTLSGAQAEMFMRFRKNNDGTSYPMGDLDRVAAQKTFYESALDRLISGKTILKIPKILGIITENIKTDFSGNDIIKYVSKIPSFKMENVNIQSLPGEAGYGEDGVSYFFHSPKETELLMDELFFSKENSTTVQEELSPKNKYVKVKIIDATGIKVEQADVLKVVSDKLKDYKFNVVSFEKVDRIKDHSKLINHNGKNAAELVKAAYPNVNTEELIEEFVKEGDEEVPDVTLVIGADFLF